MNDDPIASILDDVLVRRASGEIVADEDVLAAHPECAAALRIGLDRLRTIGDANASAASDAHAVTMIGDVPDSTDSRMPEDQALDGRAPGERIAHYVLYERLGHGGFGSVWLAWDQKLECHVAVKIPRQKFVNVHQVMREARLVAGLPRHPNIVGVLAADTDGDTPFIVSEYIDGVTLADWIATNAPNRFRAAELCRKIADALAHIHSAGVIHRDLKPDNVLINASGEPCVTDFGLAIQHIDANGQTELVGTIPYMSPEQVLRKPVDARSDVYAIGVILFELLTGQRPFRGNVNALVLKIPEQEPPSPRSLVDNRHICKDIESITLKCLEKTRERRYGSAADLRDDLQRFLDRTPVVARPVTPFGQLTRWCQRHPVVPLVSVTLLAGMLVLVVVAGLLLGQQVDAMQNRLQQTAQNGLQNSALTLQRLLEAGLRENFRVVADAANDSSLKEELRQARDAITTGQTNSKVQRWFESFDTAANRNEADSPQKFFSWFVCNSSGVQIFRSPHNSSTVGVKFAYRSYFSGRPRDTAEDEPGDTVWKPGDKPRLSDVFLTRDDTAWVMAISAPIWDDRADPEDHQRLLGVVGVFLTVRDFLDNLMPMPPSARRYTRFAYLLYERDASGQARIIDHPFQSEAVAKNGHTIRDDVANVTISMNPESAGLSPDAPFEVYKSIGPADSNLRSVAAQRSNQQWLSSAEQVAIPFSSNAPRLHVVVCESVRLVADPARDLRRNLIYLGLATLGLVVALLLPVWVIITRRLLV